MTDERDPSGDVLDVIFDALERHHGFSASFASVVLDALSAAGFVVVRAPGLNHGDELVRVDGMRVRGTQDNPKFTPTDSWVRRPVPEPATGPELCATCDYCHGAIKPDHLWCTECGSVPPARGGSGVATTEGNET